MSIIPGPRLYRFAASQKVRFSPEYSDFKNLANASSPSELRKRSCKECFQRRGALWRRYLTGSKILYQIWPQKLFFCTAIFISFESLPPGFPPPLLSYTARNVQISKHSIFYYYWTKNMFNGTFKIPFLLILVGDV